MEEDFTRSFDKIGREIDGYILVNTNYDILFTSINDMLMELYGINEPTMIFQAIEYLNRNHDKYRFGESADGNIICLEDNITSHISEMRTDAIKDMQIELEKCVKVEDYEGAGEWLRIINES